MTPLKFKVKANINFYNQLIKIERNLITLNPCILLDLGKNNSLSKNVYFSFLRLLR